MLFCLEDGNHVTQAGTNWTEQNMALFVVFLAAILVPSCLGSDGLLGGIEERKPDDPEVLDALDFAMNEFNAMQNNLYRLMPTKVSDATVQVRAKLCLGFFQFR